jgi:hypothetical protein
MTRFVEDLLVVYIVPHKLKTIILKSQDHHYDWPNLVHRVHPPDTL